MLTREQEGDLNVFSVQTCYEETTPTSVNKTHGQQLKLVVSVSHLKTPAW